MNQQNVWALTLSSDTFNALKSDFDQVLRKTLTNMENKESEQAELTVKLKISLMKEQAPNFDSLIPGAQREVIKPKFDHKVSSVMQIKDEKTGTLSGNYELVWDGELGQYVMREIKYTQLSIFEYDKEVYDEDALKGRKVLSITGSTEEFVDADYRIVDEDMEKDEDDSNDTEDENLPDDEMEDAETKDVQDTDKDFYDGYQYDSPEEEADGTAI